MDTLVEESSLVGAVNIIWQQLEENQEIKTAIIMNMEETAAGSTSERRENGQAEVGKECMACGKVKQTS